WATAVNVWVSPPRLNGRSDSLRSRSVWSGLNFQWPSPKSVGFSFAWNCANVVPPLPTHAPAPRAALNVAGSQSSRTWTSRTLPPPPSRPPSPRPPPRPLSAIAGAPMHAISSTPLKAAIIVNRTARTAFLHWLGPPVEDDPWRDEARSIGDRPPFRRDVAPLS